MLGNRSVDDGETETRRVSQLVRLKVYGPPAKEDSSIVAHRIILGDAPIPLNPHTGSR